MTVAAPNVNLTCGGRSITDSGDGVFISSTYNTTVSGCSMSNDTYGLASKNSFGSYISNLNISRSVYGIYFQNSTSGTVSNIIMTNNTYGVYLNLSNGVTFTNLNARGNKYGVYAASGGSEVFRGGALLNNTKADLYCTAQTYNSSYNLVQNMACGVTDCSWQGTSACKAHILPSLLAYPIGACQAITSPGNYTLTQGVLAKGTCFSIQASNVIFSCGGHNILGNSAGNAFTFSNRSNVTISNCNINQFVTGVNASRSKGVRLASLTMANITQGVRLSRVTQADVANVTLRSYTVTGFNFTQVNASTVTQDYALNGAGGASGFVFTNGTGDRVAFNNAGPNPGYGFSLTGFAGDSFYNNSAFDNSGSDYYCSPSSAGYYANPVGINLGLTKNACRWLIDVPRTPNGPGCQAIASTGDVVLGGDLLYPYGGTCFSVYGNNQTKGNGTVINCNGHTVYAGRGGTFANIVNSSGVTVENCYLANFTTGVTASGPYASIVNDTILNSGTAAALSGSRFGKVANDRMENDTYGIVASNSDYATILNNNLYSTANAISISGGSAVSLGNNTANLGVYGIVLSNSSSLLLQNNLVQGMSVSGMYCTGASASKGAQNHDLGGNQCSSNRNCTWITSSPLCPP